jgi:hypothetical protein
VLNHFIFSSPAPDAHRRFWPSCPKSGLLGDGHPDAFIRTAPRYLLAMFLIHQEGKFCGCQEVLLAVKILLVGDLNAGVGTNGEEAEEMQEPSLCDLFRHLPK